MRLSIEVNENDVNLAIELMRKATQHAATDPHTGLLDMDTILTGKTASSRLRVNKIREEMKKILIANLSQFRKPTSFDYIMNELHRLIHEDEPIKDGELLEAMRML